MRVFIFDLEWLNVINGSNIPTFKHRRHFDLEKGQINRECDKKPQGVFSEPKRHARSFFESKEYLLTLQTSLAS